MDQTERGSHDGPKWATRWVVTALLALVCLQVGCMAPVLVIGGYTQASSPDESVRWPEDLSSGKSDQMPVYQLAEGAAGALQDRCVSRQDLDGFAAGLEPTTQVRIEAIRESKGLPATNWALLPYNFLSAVSLGIVPMVFIYEREIEIAARLETAADRTAKVVARASDHRAEWLFIPLALAPPLTWVEKRWDSPPFTKNLDDEAAAELLRKFRRAKPEAAPASGASPDAAEPILIPCFPQRDAKTPAPR